MAENICVIDVGTTKVCAIIADVFDDETFEVIGVGRAPSDGLSKGIVGNVAAASASIGLAVEEAERAANQSITSAYVGIAGSHIQATPSKAAVPINRSRVVTVDDIERVKEAAKTIALPHNREIIHVVARSFSVDDQEDIQDPLGMHGYRLGVDAQVVSGSTGAVRNLVSCVQTHGIEVEELVLEPLASGEAVLTDAEREMGVVVIDIGGGTSDLAIFMNSTLWHTYVLDVGGNHLTQDLATGLGAPFEAAEELKVRYGHAISNRVAPDHQVTAELFGETIPQPIPRLLVAEILEARAEEMIEMVLREIKRSGYEGLMPAGLVLTGGSSQLTGIRDLSRELSKLPVRVGSPNGLPGLDKSLRTPDNATGVGLLLWAMDHRWGGNTYGSNRAPSPLVERIMRWLRNLLPG